MVRKILFLLLGLLPALCVQAQGFKVRAFYIDCRAQVMEMSAIKEMCGQLSREGYNTLLMEYEATFPFRDNATLRNRFAYTEAEVKDLVAYCKRLGIDVVPLQNCFGHCEYILRHKRYAALKEDSKEVSQVCPLKKELARKVFTSIFKEVAALHPSPYFHIGADETYLLGSCKDCRKVDRSELFVDYVKLMCDIVHGLGKRPVIWADMIMKHPEAIDRLPKDLVCVDWNYGWKPDRFGNIEKVMATGATIWGATALRSAPDDVHTTQWGKHFDNLRTFVPYARSHGYEGMVQTSWSTSGTYGFHYDGSGNVTSMQPVRQVYPMPAFGILMSAFAKAVSMQADSLDVASFVNDYGRARYGLGKDELGIFSSFFRARQEVVPSGSAFTPDSVGKMAEAAESLCKALGKIEPRQNRREFDNYKLMLEIRICYLRLKQIEAAVESPYFNGADGGQLLYRLNAAMSRLQNLKVRFSALTKGFLKAGQTDDVFLEMDELAKELKGILTER